MEKLNVTEKELRKIIEFVQRTNTYVQITKIENEYYISGANSFRSNEGHEEWDFTISLRVVNPKTIKC